MMYRAMRSFVDPVTRRPYFRGQEYPVVDALHAEYLERHKLIEPVKDSAPAEQPAAGADAPKAKPKRKKSRR